MFDGLNASGRQICTGARSNALVAGRTPTIACGSLLRRTVRLTMVGSPPNWVIHRL